MAETGGAALRRTPLAGLHAELGARVVPFAGYALPVQYPRGILAEHRHCRTAAALFDVSHMGQARIEGPEAARALERLVPADILGLSPGRQRYTVLTNEAGGILDDLMVANAGDHLFLVVNAARKEADFAHLAAFLPASARLTPLGERALLALQGPKAADVLARFGPEVAALPFMGVATVQLASFPAFVSRSGYTGEDGFEISVPAEGAETLARRLLAEPEVAPAGLGARDSLRLEAGLPLYGADLDETTDPVSASLAWTIGKRRRIAWDFCGGIAIRRIYEHGPERKRVGLRPEGRAPIRAGTDILDSGGKLVGRITSGGYSPSLDAPIAMGYVGRDLVTPGTVLTLPLRGRLIGARIAALPFLPHRYPQRGSP